MASKWFSKHFTEKGEDEKKDKEELRKQQGKEEGNGVLVSKLPPYDFHNWQDKHKGYRGQRLLPLLKKNIIASITMVILIAAFASMFMSYFSASFYYDAETQLVYRVPDQAFAILGQVTAAMLVVFVAFAALVTLSYRRAFDRFYENSKVHRIAARNFLGERWYFDLYNGGSWEKEPIGRAKLEEQKNEVTAKLAKLNAELKNPPETLDGQPLSDGEKEKYKIMVQAEITKYQDVDKRIDAYLNNKMTLWSCESRDHKYIWGHHIVENHDNGTVKKELVVTLEKEVGWKYYVAVPGPSMEDCTGWNEFPTDLGWKTKKLDNMMFSVTPDLPTHQETIVDPETDTSVIVEVPIFGVRDTPNQGLYYDWREADGILVSKVLDLPLSTSYRSESEQKDSTIADLEHRILDIKEERLQLLIPEILDELRRAGRLPEQPQTQIPVQPVMPTVHHSISKASILGWAAAIIISVISVGLHFL